MTYLAGILWLGSTATQEEIAASLSRASREREACNGYNDALRNGSGNGVVCAARASLVTWSERHTRRGGEASAVACSSPLSDL